MPRRIGKGAAVGGIAASPAPRPGLRPTAVVRLRSAGLPLATVSTWGFSPHAIPLGRLYPVVVGLHQIRQEADVLECQWRRPHSRRLRSARPADGLRPLL